MVFSGDASKMEEDVTARTVTKWHRGCVCEQSWKIIVIKQKMNQEPVSSQKAFSEAFQIFRSGEHNMDQVSRWLSKLGV